MTGASKPLLDYLGRCKMYTPSAVILYRNRHGISLRGILESGAQKRAFSRLSACSYRCRSAKPHSSTPPNVITSSCRTLVCYSASPNLSLKSLSCGAPHVASLRDHTVQTIRHLRYHSEYVLPTMNTQTMDGRYVDREKLVKLLKDLFGAGNFQIKVGFFATKLRELSTDLLSITYRPLTTIIRFPRLGHLLRYSQTPILLYLTE